MVAASGMAGSGWAADRLSRARADCLVGSVRWALRPALSRLLADGTFRPLPLRSARSRRDGSAPEVPPRDDRDGSRPAERADSPRAATRLGVSPGGAASPAIAVPDRIGRRGSGRLGLIPAIRRQVALVDEDQPLTNVQTMEEVVGSASAQPRFTMLLLAVFSATALILAIVGIYGVIAYSVAQRTAELGIRMALGADQGDVLKLVVGHGLRLTVTGIAIGLAGALALTRLMSSLLYQTSATDPIAFLASALLFTVVAVLASYLPARRATRIDPTQALR